MKLAILGLGEVGRIYASAFAAQGHEVTGYDPFPPPAAPEGTTTVATIPEAVANADAVVVFTPAGAAEAAAHEAFGHLKVGALYLDMTSAAPALMASLSAQAPQDSFVDGAILGAVISLREKTPVIVSGARSAEAAALLAPLGAKVTDVAGIPGDATSRKLCRSVAGKGLAAVCCEAMEAARAAGIEEWMRDELAGLLPGDGRAVLARYESGTRKHAARRAHEMDDVVAYLTTLGAPTTLSQATASLHHRYAEEATR